jgi:hypothetical protein
VNARNSEIAEQQQDVFCGLLVPAAAQQLSEAFLDLFASLVNLLYHYMGMAVLMEG